MLRDARSTARVHGRPASIKKASRTGSWPRASRASVQLCHPQLVRAFTTECKDDLVARRGVHPDQERLLERADRSMRLRDASLDADRHELPEDSGARMTQKEETLAVTGPRQSRHTVLVLRRE